MHFSSELFGCFIDILEKNTSNILEIPIGFIFGTDKQLKYITCIAFVTWFHKKCSLSVDQSCQHNHDDCILIC